MFESTKEQIYLKVVESLGELLTNKDQVIKFNEYEIKSLKNKVARLEKEIEFYEQPEDEILSS